ncbi:GGDEF domain-containing protein [Blautia sp. HCP3S3_H10_1]|uniref:GGDEF domain-containing protein n=1 Tax=unclassified Blautia TaxID=2648079 RepID=UPI003F93C4F6
MNTDLSFSVLTANVISLLLIGTLYLSNRQRMSQDKDMRIVLQMMGITAISNVTDCCVFYLDGSSGIFLKVLVFLSGSWLFLGNVLIGYTWARFIMTHLNIPFTDTRRKIYRIGGLVACLLLIINIFYPLVFSINDGVYQRGPAYSVFLFFAVLYILDSLYLYARCRKKVGTLKLFPVQVFFVPIIIGVTVQAFFIEIAITWTSIAIAIAGIMTALKNEIIFLDCLTGLYNRGYLEFLQKQAYKKKNVWVSGFMIDLNGFKQINDNYGHSEGDVALKIAADLLRKSFGEYGVVTRYAGDEFVVMLNTTDEQLVQSLIQRAKQNFEAENKTNRKPYQLSASMGYATSDLRVETIADFMNRIDHQMYQDKLAYYKKNDRRKR